MNKELKDYIVKKLTDLGVGYNVSTSAENWLTDGVTFKTISQVRREEYLKEIEEEVKKWNKDLSFQYMEVDNGVYECLVFKEKN